MSETAELKADVARLRAVIEQAIDLINRNELFVALDVLSSAVEPRDATRPFVNPPGI